jgi:hypothetical protein
MPTTKRNSRQQSPEAMMEKWLAKQGKAVDLEYEKLKKKTPRVAPVKDTRTAEQILNDNNLARIIGIIEKCDGWRKDLEEDGYRLDGLLRIVRAGDMINGISIKRFNEGFFDEEMCPSASNHDIKVTHERMSGTPISRLWVDGKSVLLGTMDS